MALGQRLELKQGQGLVITPQLQQAIKLLQLSNLELEAVIETELERNPLLQRDDSDPVGEGNDADAHAQAADSGESRELELGDRDTIAANSDLDASASDVYGDDEPVVRERESVVSDSNEGPMVDWSKAGKGGGSFDGDEDMERALTREKTLTEHLTDQALIAHFSAPEMAIAQILIDAVDEAGYMRVPLAEIADRLGCELALVEKVLTACQGFEPTGIMATSVPECLKLQLIERNRFDPAMAALIDNLELLARRDLSALRKVCGVDEEDLSEMIAELKSLNPRPGAAYGAEPSQTVVPDVFVRPDANGGWRIDLNSDTLPRVLVDQKYHAKVATSARSESEKSYLNDCLSQANWLIKSLDQRARTILKVSAEIVRQQDAFFVYGVEYLRPLNLKTVADAVGMHESTISRVTSNKYVATPRGVFELKFFFTSSIASNDGTSAHSAEAVRHKIKTLIDGEKASGEILSDDRIVEILKEAGVDIARRTVAKYREALRIPSSVERKRQIR
ncbi:RNA polymerase factor sigma-54 [Asticcacaulis taihuensis]|jgi:RNA polymerase sigma-54 factor|uniref:RNA polymerase sigma-54 factor n=1 Tax=Asticcacaulis taihuensis TaxID=260084 RepID=A0A1G4RHU4_9CAUL|nr:RNA polymerase factor sigma-54 [Asticcacaulis taihuensis]SCW56336.1 RNA polymerase, sigma 54 subunit, RpoN/SigL [Asticcacaulis taihuensis]